MLTAPTVTGWSGFWQMQGDHAIYAMSLSQNRFKDSKLIARNIKAAGGRDVIGALAALIGAAAGGTATNQWSEVGVPAGPNSSPPQVTGIADFGGNRPIVTTTAINRATTAADVTELKKWFNNALLEAGITYPAYLGSSVARGTMHANTPGFS
jgi:hypothetical protein